ncbi:hypothetical protein [Oceanobacillus sp. CAU 1775]
MEDREIYFLFTDTGSYLSRMIGFFTKEELNHVSISFSEDFSTLYSFGRKRPRNPFIGGFVNEDIQNEFMAKSKCEIYRQAISKEDYDEIINKIKEIEEKRDEYRYNFIGLVGVLFHIQIKRKSALFCSQFVAEVIQGSEKFKFDKPNCFITPADIRKYPGNEFVFKGKLCEYRPKPMKLVLGENTRSKQSFIYYISNKFRRFVIK